MAYQDQFYTVGTVTVTNDSTAVTGAGTGWETALIVGGVFYAGGGAYPIQSVSSETELTLAIPYVGDDASGVGYAIDRQRAAAISNIAMNDRLAQIIREISIGNIEDLNALELIANQIIHTDTAGNLSQSAITAAAVALLNLAGTPAADGLPYLNSANSASLTGFSALARTLLGNTTAAQMWGTLGGTQGIIGGSNGTGYARLPGSIFLQWGTSVITPNSGGYGSIPFPQSFSNTSWHGVIMNGDQATHPRMIISKNRSALAANRFDVLCVQSVDGSPVTSPCRLDYVVIGQLI